ncbi:MAG TPA: FixH family protein [Burkholderiaceae bacterium]|nr:FixH family protein [Burkholderiaceae bacterium]
MTAMKSAAMMSAPATNVKPWYRHIWPWLLILGPLSVVVAGSYTAWLAFSRQDALVVDDYYRRGQSINQDLRRDRVATGLELASMLRYDAAAGRLVGTVSSHGAPYTGRVFLHLVHSTQPEKDLNLEAQLDSHGEFSIALPMLEMANWQVLLENGSREWRLNGAWTWPHQKAVAMRAEASPAAR